MQANGGISEGSRSILVLPHHRQKYNWDCGLSCILMVLPDQERRAFLSNFNKVCAEEEFNRSTWTIDLCYLLKRFNAQHSFFTITLGVHPGHSEQAFYSRILSKDEARVTKRFTEAASHGLTVQERSLTPDELIGHLRQEGPIILLTNANLLVCDLCKNQRLSMGLRQCLGLSSSYQGHYIVLCGYDLNKQVFFYRNPTFKDRICAMSYEALNNARTSYGTDEDAILVFNSDLERKSSLGTMSVS